MMTLFPWEDSKSFASMWGATYTGYKFAGPQCTSFGANGISVVLHKHTGIFILYKSVAIEVAVPEYLILVPELNSWTGHCSEIQRRLIYVKAESFFFIIHSLINFLLYYYFHRWIVWHWVWVSPCLNPPSPCFTFTKKAHYLSWEWGVPGLLESIFLLSCTCVFMDCF